MKVLRTMKSEDRVAIALSIQLCTFISFLFVDPELDPNTFAIVVASVLLSQGLVIIWALNEPKEDSMCKPCRPNIKARPSPKVVWVDVIHGLHYHTSINCRFVEPDYNRVTLYPEDLLADGTLPRKVHIAHRLYTYHRCSPERRPSLTHIEHEATEVVRKDPQQRKSTLTQGEHNEP